MASPLQIEIDASNGASDYGNKFGEPVVSGFTRAFGIPPLGHRALPCPILFLVMLCRIPFVLSRRNQHFIVTLYDIILHYMTLFSLAPP